MTITEAHRDFARSIVSIAKEHGADNIQFSFRLNGCKLFLKNPIDPTHGTVSVAWCEGRHGAKGPINLTYESTETIKEKVNDIPNKR